MLLETNIKYNMKKKKGYILYFDIIGYKSLLKNNTEQENDKMATLLDSFSNIYSKSNMALGFGADFNPDKLIIRSFSDNFLFVYESQNDNVLELVNFQWIASLIQYQFLCVGILTRGSITYGTIFYNEHIVFGQDLIKAVELEGNHKTPSIIVDESLKSVFANSCFEFKNEIDLFNVHANSPLDYQDCIKGLEKYVEHLNRISVDDNILEKANYVIEKLNDYFEQEQNVKCFLRHNTKYYIAFETN